jgi:hypothetical protein
MLVTTPESAHDMFSVMSGSGAGAITQHRDRSGYLRLDEIRYDELYTQTAVDVNPCFWMRPQATGAIA